MKDKLIAKRVIIKGKVQGVGYRVWTQRTAREIGLCGWVRNLSDGSVEAFFQGRGVHVIEMIKSCNDGPRFSIVSEVEQFEDNFDESMTQFLILD